MAAVGHDVRAVRDDGEWQVFVDGFLVTTVTRWPSVSFVAREWIAVMEGTTSREVDLHVSVVGRNQYIDVPDDAQTD